jgi:Holliday junction DNA helicase RuvB
MLGRARDVAHSRGTERITHEHVLEASDLDGIDAEGLRREDRRLLGILMDRRGPIGLRTLSDLMGMDSETVQRVLEPFLLRNGFLQRTWRGRIATEKARARYSVAALRA